MDKINKLNVISENIQGCQKCPLHKTPGKYVLGEGDVNAEVVFVGEAPGQTEAMTGRPFVGRAGQLLDKMIGSMGARRDDVYVCNICKCRPPNNRKPMPEEMDACMPFLKEQLAAVDPLVIITLGATATEGLLGPGPGITKRGGTWGTWNDIPVMPTFHPSYCLRNQAVKKDVYEDLMSVVEFLVTK